MNNRELVVPYFQSIRAQEEDLNILFNGLSPNCIDQVSWKEYSYKPEVIFKIAYSDKAIVLKYEVNERHLRINNFKTNSRVWEDSCVECFISFREGFYYNIEFNALGVCLIGYGTQDRSLRTRLPDYIIERIKSFSAIHSRINEHQVSWHLTVYIPLEVFKYEQFNSIKGLDCTANFYKCGDLLPVPHYLSWSPVLSASPNFHLPESFGKIRFN